jgi:hypothetical protein
MYRLILAFANWLQNTPMALAVGGSDWAYPYVQLTHFTGLSLWVGTSLALDVRLLGFGKGRQSPAELLDSLFVWNWIGFGLTILGGFLLFSIAAASFVSNLAFRAKLGILIPLALAVHVFVQAKARAWSETPDPPAAAKLAGLMEILLWLLVATAAVSIPYF